METFLFQYEEEILKKAQQECKSASPENELIESFRHLCKRYEKLLSQSKKIVKISDNQQKMLNETNEKLLKTTMDLNTANFQLENKNHELLTQKTEIAKKNNQITGSINYARHIQEALLPKDQHFKELIPEYFVLFRPRDIVSGDFYWVKQVQNYAIFVAADCTGHGVPGALLSMLGIAFLNDIIRRLETISAAYILEELRKLIKNSLHQSGNNQEAKDGMDIALCLINLSNNKMQFAGANNPIYIVRKSENNIKTNFDGIFSIDNGYELFEIKPDKMPIGVYLKDNQPFSNKEIQLQQDDVVYMFSDGYIDQFGGELNRKFMAKNLKKLLLQIQNLSMNQQKKELEQTIITYMASNEQIDDMLLMGIKIPKSFGDVDLF